MEWDQCVFCRGEFPAKYLVISEKPKYWTFLHNIRPVCDFHCLVVLKKEAMFESHADGIGMGNVSEEALSELGILLNRASMAIRRCSEDIRNIHVASLNSWSNSKHLHFHLIPVCHHDQVKKVNEWETDGGGFWFLARKEIVDDTLDEFIRSTCWESATAILSSISDGMDKRIIRNVEILRKSFDF